MRKLVFRPKSIMVILTLLSTYVISGVGFFLMVSGIIDLLHTTSIVKSVGNIVLGISSSILGINAIISVMNKRICFQNSYVFVHKDVWSALLSGRHQYELRLRYEEISKLSFKWGCIDSQGNRKSFMWAPHLFLSVCLANGKEQLIHIMFYSRKQIQQIVLEIKKRANCEIEDLEIKKLVGKHRKFY